MIGPYRIPLAQTKVVQRALAAFRAASARRRRMRKQLGAGFTLIELVLVITIIGILSALAIPRLQGTVEQARIAHAIGDIKAMQTDIDGTSPPPANLAAIGRPGVTDPWGNAYVYNYHGGGGGGRTDRFGVSLNSEYDLYSVGPDGASALAITAGASADDITRAGDGWVGLGKRY